jgi:hypothetical protein
MGDWVFERKNLEQPVNDLPGLQPHLILARVDAHLLPAMAFLQVNLTGTSYLAPYAGIAAGYEWLLLNAHDHRTGETATARFANWAWEGWEEWASGWTRARVSTSSSSTTADRWSAR